MESGDIITENGKIGIIEKQYDGAWDWEIVYITGSVTGCRRDCCYGNMLKPYHWKPYPKTWKQIFLVILQKLFPNIDFYKKDKYEKKIADRI